MSDSCARSVQVSLLGSFSISVNETQVKLPPQCERLVAYLALNGGTVDRDRLVDVLWPDTTASRGCASLRTATWRTRAACGTSVVQATQAGVQLLVDVDIDIVQAGELGVALLEGDGRPTENLYALDPLAPLLAGWFEDWVVLERERIAQLHLRYAEGLVRQLVIQGSVHLALAVALQAVSLDRLRQSAHRTLMLVYCAEGNVAQAIAYSREVAAYIEQECGVRPVLRMDEIVAESEALVTYGRESRSLDRSA